MEISKLYKMIEEIGCLTFSTINEKGEVHSRIAHFNGYDEEGLYFRTMVNKPYFRQLVNTGKLTVCGMTDSRVLDHNDDGTPVFPLSYVIRLIGDIRKVSDDVIIEKAKTNKMLVTATQDMEKYPSMKGANFVMHKFKGEIFDTDFEMVNRDHKLYRERFSFGGVEFNNPGPRINELCIECGKCKDVCSFFAIEEGSPYKVIHNKCDDCGMCLLSCPVDAIEESLEF